MRSERIWRWWLAGGLLAVAGYCLLPAGSLTSSLWYDAIGAASGVAILFAVRRYRPEHRAMWLLFAAGQFASVLGDLTYEYYAHVLHVEPYPSMADLFYLAAYPLLAAGLYRAVRRRPGRREVINPALVIIGLGLVFWVFVLRPIATEPGIGPFERVVSSTYPLADLLLLAMIAGLITHAGRPTPSIRLLALAATTQLAGDTAYSLMTLHGVANTLIADAGLLAAYLLWAAAALHPSMATTPTGENTKVIAYAWMALLAPALLLVPGVGAETADRFAVGIACLLLFALVIARMTRMLGRMRDLALRDDLTGLANRRRLEQELAATLDRNPRVVLFGLHGFKNLNDELGRPVGDQVLRVLAGRLTAHAPKDALVARSGGDEFALILLDRPGSDVEQADQLAAVLRDPVPAGGHELLVGVGAGLAGADGNIDGDEILRRAEAALHAARTAIRTWTPDLDERAGEHARLGAEMRTGLATGQFRLVYQPIVESATGRIAAAEALVRWEHPTRGLVSPAHFIPVAEQNGLIVELGEWILRTACRRMVSLGDDAPDRISVNVSARQLSRPGFARTVALILDETGLEPRRLAVEVTETAVFEGGPAVTALHELRRLGVRIALDDFGTGHSSLGLLQTVPVDILKVDKSFVDDICSPGRQAVIAEALIQVSDGLGLTAVAEGVETAEQAAALHRLGYRLLQGYYFGRPAAELTPRSPSPPASSPEPPACPPGAPPRTPHAVEAGSRTRP